MSGLLCCPIQPLVTSVCGRTVDAHSVVQAGGVTMHHLFAVKGPLVDYRQILLRQASCRWPERLCDFEHGPASGLPPFVLLTAVYTFTSLSCSPFT